MEMLQSKLSFMKDLQVEYQSSMHSVEFVRDNYQVMLGHIESQITRRTHEKGKFVTKIGVSLRELILQHYNTVVKHIHSSYCQSEEIYVHLLEQQQALNQTICHAQHILRNLQNLTVFTSEKTLKYTTLKAAISKQQQIIKESSQLKEMVYEQDYQMNIKETSKGKDNTDGRKQRRYRLNLMLIEQLGNQGFVEMGEKVRKTQVDELNCNMDQCLNSTANFTYLKSKLKLRPKSRSFNSCPNNSRPSDLIEHYKSLGIQSAFGEKEQLDHSQINLMCDQDINKIMVISKSNSLTFGDLKKITERDECLQSDESSRILKESIVLAN